MRVIVTGANGFVGSNLVNRLVEKGFEILAVDISFKNLKIKKNDLVHFLELSMDEIETLKYKIAGNFDLFYHFAWLGSAGELRSDEKVQTQNALWTVRCLKVAKELGCKKFICAGSIMEFEVNEVIYTQNTKPSVNYIYGVGKVLAHELCKPIANSLNISLVWAYITNAYGVGEKSPRFVNTTLRKIIHGEKLEFTSGLQNYDFIYIDDVVEAFLLLGLYGKSNKGYMIGSGNARPLKEFIIEMCKRNSPDNPPVFGSVPYTGVNLPLEIFSTREIENDCGFKAKVSFAEGTEKTLVWLKKEDGLC